MNRRFIAVALLAVAPLTMAAADPRGDAVRCKGVPGPGYPPDLVRAFLPELRERLREGRRLTAAASRGLEGPHTDLAERLYAAAQAQGHGGEDLAVVVTALDSASGR